jgi:hypothetical protein
MQTVCKRCGKINQTAANTGYCSICQPLERMDYEVVRDYVNTHPKAQMIEVHKQTNVSLKVIDRMIQNGGLVVVENKIEEKEE